MMRKPSCSALGVVSILCILLLAACGSSRPVLHYVTVAPNTAPVNIGQTQQFTATGYYSDGTSKDLTTNSSLTWASSNTSVASITSGGLATGVSAGTVTITASLGSQAGTATLAVTGATGLVVTPKYSTIAAVGGTQQFTATTTILNPDGTTSPGTDVTASATWTSSQTGVATIDSTQDATNGLATGVAAGVTQISASYLGASSNSVTLTVGGITVVKLTPVPATATLAAGQTLQYSATETLSDSSTQPAAPGAVAWTISCTPASAASIGATTGLAVTTASAAGASCTVTGTETLTGIPSSISGTASLSVTAAVARFAYVGNGGGGTISEYAANPAGGALTLIGKFPAISPQQVLVHPSGKYLYTIAGNSYVHVYDINATTGALVEDTSLAGTPYQAGSGAGINKGVIDPTGSFLYVVDGFGGSNEVWGFGINQTTGGLTAISPVAVGADPSDVLVDSTGAYLYVINATDGDISGFKITPSTGVLVANNTAAAPYTAASLGTPSFGTIDPTNKYVYVPDGGSNVNAYQIGATGTLTVAGAPTTIAAALSLTNLAIDPGGKYAYVVDSGANPGAVYSFSVTAGVIGAAIGTTAALAGNTPFGIVVDPSSTLLAVSNNFSNTISLFQIGGTGALTVVTPASTGSEPLYLAYDIATAAATVAPAEVVTANKTTGDISAFTVASGMLTADTNAYTGVAGNSQIGSSVTGSLFFTGSASGKKLAGYSLNAANTPPIAPLANSPLTLAGAAGTVIADPSGLFVYVADTTNGLVRSYTYNSTTNSLVANSTAPAIAITGLQALVSDPQVDLIFALSSNGTITPILAGNDGLLTATTSGPQSFAGNNWTTGVVDASGQYLLVVDATANKVHAYSISPIENSATDGQLTAVGSATALTGATLVAGIAVDPLDRFLLITDATANTITPYTYNPATQALVAGTAVSVASGAGQVTIDATGKYVFVALAGAAGGTPASGVAAYTVAFASNTVTLTAVTGSPFTTGTGASGTTGVGVISSVN